MICSLRSELVRSLRSKGWLKVFCVGSFVFRSLFFCSASFSIALTALPNHTSPPRAAPSEDYFHAGGLGARLFREGR